MLCPKTPRIRDKKYRDSFKIYGGHKCLITGLEFSEYSSESVDGAHITIGSYARGMKASDDLILPLVHSLHLEFDRNQEAFIDEYFFSFFDWGYEMDILADREYGVDFVKDRARAYYKQWKEGEENET